MAGLARFRIVSIAATLVVAATSFLAALPARTVAFVRDLFVGLVDARPFRDLFEAPRLALDGPAGHPIDAALYQRNRHEAGLAKLGAVRHT